MLIDYHRLDFYKHLKCIWGFPPVGLGLLLAELPWWPVTAGSPQPLPLPYALVLLYSPADRPYHNLLSGFLVTHPSRQ